MISPEQAELFKKLNNRKCEAMFYPHFEYQNPKDKKVDVTKISYIHPICVDCTKSLALKI